MSAVHVAAQVEAPEAPPQPAQLTPIMPLDEVRIGMRGYGMTIFHGTEIEPFPVEVISITPNETPQHTTIWVLCDDPRLNVSGPVQGLSGSPIYLWDEGEQGEPGVGGRLVGAFAFGYAGVKQCQVGVQPIEYMREVAEDAHDGGERRLVRRGDPIRALKMLSQLRAAADRAGTPRYARLRLDLIHRIMRQSLGATVGEPIDGYGRPLPEAPDHRGRVMRMMLPMAVGTPEAADLIAPLLSPHGIRVYASDALGGAPPPGIDPQTVELKPGSVLSVPLAFGDADLSASGTVTEVLPDGTVLAFGHAMFGQGPVAVPMATGYVHFVVPTISSSFRLAGSLEIKGSLVQDQMSAVAGNDQRIFETAPVEIAIRIAGQPEHTYHYEVVDHPLYTPIICAILAINSFSAVQDAPVESTVRVRGELRFSDGSAFPLNSIMPNADSLALITDLLPIVTAMLDNPYEDVRLESISLEADVTEGVELASLIEARLDRAEVAPGGVVGINLRALQYKGDERTYRIEFPIPDDIEEGDYSLIIGDATTFLYSQIAARPHLLRAHNLKQYVQAMQHTMIPRPNAIYTVMSLNRPGIAVGRDELPDLPSSVRAMIATPSTTNVTPYSETIHQQQDTELVIAGEFSFMVSVRKQTNGKTEAGAE